MNSDKLDTDPTLHAMRGRTNFASAQEQRPAEASNVQVSEHYVVTIRISSMITNA